MRLLLEDSEPSVMGGSNPSTDSRTKVKCSAYSSIHPGIKVKKVSYLLTYSMA